MSVTSSPQNMTSESSAYDASLGYHPSVLPLDISLGLTSPPSRGGGGGGNPPSGPLRWGILATGKVAHDFVLALKFLSHSGLPHSVAAAGSRSLGRAEEFAARHGIPRAHGDYRLLCADEGVDVVYVASLHPSHREHAELALRCGKHVLVEKPICMTADDATFLYELGRERGLFVGEGMWTRFFPAVEWARAQLGRGANDDGIGTVRAVQCDFCIDGTDVGPYPSDSLYDKELGGGSAWTLLPYPLGQSIMPFGKAPNKVCAAGIIPDDAVAGDIAVGVTLTFDNGDDTGEGGDGAPPGGVSIASGMCGYIAESSEEAMYAARGGRITLHGPAHCPTSASIRRKSAGRGNGNGGSDDDGVDSEVRVEFPLPQLIPETKSKNGCFKMPNSIGFIYEAEAVRRLIESGEGTFPQWTPAESVACIATIEEVLRQLGGD